MQFFSTVTLALAATVTAMPQQMQQRDTEEVSIQGCGSNMCPGAVAIQDADCPLDCMWGQCVKYNCPNDGYDVRASLTSPDSVLECGESNK